MMRWTVAVFIILWLTSPAFADEIRPGYVELKEERQNIYAVLWKVPQKSGQKLLLKPRFPQSCSNKAPITSQQVKGALIQRWYIHCADGMVGRRISIEGLELTNTDVLLRMEFMGGTSLSVRLTHAEPSFQVPAEALLPANYSYLYRIGY